MLKYRRVIADKGPFLAQPTVETNLFLPPMLKNKKYLSELPVPESFHQNRK